MQPPRRLYCCPAPLAETPGDTWWTAHEVFELLGRSAETESRPCPSSLRRSLDAAWSGSGCRRVGVMYRAGWGGAARSLRHDLPGLAQAPSLPRHRAAGR